MTVPPPPPSEPFDASRDDVAPRPAGSTPVPAVAPSPIRAAVILMYVGAALQVLILTFSWLTRDHIRRQLADDQSLSAGDVDTLYNATVGLLVVISVLAIAMWIWMAQVNRRGYGWARIVAAVLAGLNVAFTVFLLAQSTGLGVVMQLVAIALAATIVFLLYRPESSAYYTAA